ncbi:MAG: 2-oxo acid dehydrogenase subunit E2 [Elusimicrobia bacterium]|nr:2-oxo acid dehydrogenase subunit E2 [Elusimicrobiota bacterium]
MAFEFKLPDVGEGLSEGEIIQWHIREGEAVHADQKMVDVLTDKATVEISSPKAGTILKILADPGQVVRVGEPIVVIGQKGESFSAQGNNPIPSSASAGRGTASVARMVPASEVQGGVLATPAVRNLAKELKVDLSRISGKGPQGRITEEDVRRVAAPAEASARRPEERIPVRGIRRRTAEKMAESWAKIPHVTHFEQADVTELVALREEQKGKAASEGVKLTYLPYILVATVKALKQFPHLNSSWDESENEIVLKRYYCLAVATATEHGLFTPVIKDCDRLGIFDLAKELDRLTQKAKKNQLELSEISGGTFTVTNVGPIGGVYATPIINYPEAAILGVLKIAQKPVVREGQVIIRDILNLVLSFDHRILDGAEAAEFMKTLVQSLENPRTLV